MKVLETVHSNWSQEKINQVSQELGIVLLEEWGGPRSPLALEYLKKTIIPDLISCFRANENFLDNPTFAEIIAWKLRNQFAYPNSIVNDLSKDLLQSVQGMRIYPQDLDPKEPWRRIFRLWISGESLLSIAERTGYAFDYLNLIILRYKKLHRYLWEHRASLLDCMKNSELKEFGFEQLSFLYELQTSLAQEPLYKERLILEQVIVDLELPLKIPELVGLLEIILSHEGELHEEKLFTLFRKATGDIRNDEELTVIIEKLISVFYVLKNKEGKLTLSENSAKVISGFLVTKISRELKQALTLQDFDKAHKVINKQNPEVLELLIDWMVVNIEPEQTVKLLKANFKKINRRFDLQILNALSHFETAFDFLLNALGENDSLLRAKACEAIGYQKNINSIFLLIKLLHDPISEVKVKAAFALGEIGSCIASKELIRISEDYNEPLTVREQARTALRKISSGYIKKI